MKSIRSACLAIFFVGTIALAQSIPVPLVNNPLVPASAAPGGTDFTLTVNGTGFVSGSVVNWNNSRLDTKFISNSQLSATVPAIDIANPGTASVAVANPVPGGGTSNADFFDIRQPFTAVSFGQTILTVGSMPAFVIAADLNGDGILDLANTNFGDSTVSVLLGNGDGTFQTQVAYPVAQGAGDIAAADFNGDGHLDLAVSTSGFVSILIGNGDGTFQSHKDFGLNDKGHLVASGDFNGDGKLDLAITLNLGGQVAILLGNGDGTFQDAVDYTAGSDRAIGVTVGDFNGDGKLDLAVGVFSDNAVAILLGNGDGTFGSAKEYTTAKGPLTVITVDFNADNKLDLVVYTSSGGTPLGAISVLLGNGDGTFQNHADYAAPQGGSIGMNVADLNGDGKLDVTISNIARTVSTFLGNGDGTLQSPGFFATGSAPEGLAVGDFVGDGRLDIVTANDGDNTLSVLPQVTSVLSRTNVSFGAVKVGSSASAKVKLSNIGDASFAINKIVLTGKNPGQFRQNNDCGGTLPPGASCTIRIIFKPQNSGQFKAVVKVSDSAVNEPQTIIVMGTGTP
jgi:hypothetical protein